MKKLTTLAVLVAALALPAAAQAKRYNLIMTFGQDILLAGKEDDVAIRAQCIQNENAMGYDVVRVYAKTAHNAALRGSDTYGGNGFYLTAVTAPSDSEAVAVAVTTGQEYFGVPIDAGMVLNLTTRRGFTWTSESVIAGINNGANDCVLSINLDAIKKFKTVE